MTTHSNTDIDDILKVFWERALLAATQSFAGDPYEFTSRSTKKKLEALISTKIVEARIDEVQRIIDGSVDGSYSTSNAEYRIAELKKGEY